jgi:hypothetical protein
LWFNEENAMSVINPTIVKGRAYVRLVEAADVLLAGGVEDAERVLLEQVRQVSKLKLRAMIVSVAPKEMAQVLAASDKINAPVSEFLKN